MVQAFLTSDRDCLSDLLRVHAGSLARIMGVGILLAEDERPYFHLICSTPDEEVYQSDPEAKRAMVAPKVFYLRALRYGNAHGKNSLTAVAEMDGRDMPHAHEDAFKTLAGILAARFHETLLAQGTHNFAFFNPDRSTTHIECDMGGR